MLKESEGNFQADAGDVAIAGVPPVISAVRTKGFRSQFYQTVNKSACSDPDHLADLQATRHGANSLKLAQEIAKHREFNSLQYKTAKIEKAADGRFLNNDKWRRSFRKLLLANLN